MPKPAGRRTVTLSAALLAIISSTPLVSTAQQARQPSFTIEQILGLPTPDNLIASPAGSMIAWTFNERGVRNIYVAAAGDPDLRAHRLTAYTEDDGQELTNLVPFVGHQSVVTLDQRSRRLFVAVLQDLGQEPRFIANDVQRRGLQRLHETGGVAESQLDRLPEQCVSHEILLRC